MKVAPVIQRNDLKVLPFTVIIPFCPILLNRAVYASPFFQFNVINPFQLKAKPLRLARREKILEPDAPIISKSIKLIIR